MSDYIHIEKDKKNIAREKLKARELRKTQWWKNKIALGECHYCKEKFASKELTMDHIVPLSRGGKSTKGNVVPCCKNCNSEKNYLTLVEMILNQIKEESKNDNN